MKKNKTFNTSANVLNDAADKIREISKVSGVSISKIIQFMIITFLKNVKEEQVFNRLTEYQEKKARNYERMHYCPNKDLINQLGRSRWIYRISISKMIYCTFLLFFDEVIDHFLGKDTGNYEKNFFDKFNTKYFSTIYIFFSDIKYFLQRFNFIYGVKFKPPF